MVTKHNKVKFANTNSISLLLIQNFKQVKLICHLLTQLLERVTFCNKNVAHHEKFVENLHYFQSFQYLANWMFT